MSEAANIQRSVALIKMALELGQSEILSALEEVTTFYEQARETSESLQSLEEDVNIRGTEHTETIRGMLDEQGQTFARLIHSLVDSTSRTQSTLAASKDLRSAAQRLENASVESRLLAVNAKVQVSHVGEGAQSVNVIATAMQSLATDLGECSDEVENACTKFDAMLPELGCQVTTLSREAEVSSKKLESVADAVTESQVALFGRVIESASCIREQTLQSREAANHTLAKLQFMDRMAQLLNAAIALLDEAAIDPSVGVPDSLLEPDGAGDEQDLGTGLIFL